MPKPKLEGFLGFARRNLVFCFLFSNQSPINDCGGQSPMPVRVMTCGLPSALSLIVTVPLRMPLLAGVNVTLITQLFFGVTIPAWQVVAGPKAKFPLMATELMLRFVVPVFVSVKVFAPLVVPTFWVEKLIELELSFAWGLMIIAVRGTDCGLPAAVSVITNSADWAL